jgi:hypothetical protein
MLSKEAFPMVRNLCLAATGMVCLLALAWAPISTTDAGLFRRRLKCPTPPSRVLVIVEKGEAAKKELSNPIFPEKIGEPSIKKSLPTKPGFVTIEVEGRHWIFREGSKDVTAFKKAGEPEKCYTRINVAPYQVTLRAPDIAIMEEYLTAKPGFVTKFEDGRVWVFRQGSKDLTGFLKDGELAKHVVRPGAGPRGMTLKAPDAETIIAYMTAQEGFITFLEDGRLWVFKTASKELPEFKKNGDLAKHVIRVNAGPLGLTLKAPDGETIDLYLKACGR